MSLGRGHHRVRRHFEEAAAIDLRGAFRRGRRRRLHRRDPGPPDAGGVRGWAHPQPEVGPQPGYRWDDDGHRAALMEELAVDTRRGFFANHDLAGYEVPVHADIPHQEVIFLDEVDPMSSPMKAKGRRRTRHLRGRRRGGERGLQRHRHPRAGLSDHARQASRPHARRGLSNLKGARPCASPSGRPRLPFRDPRWRSGLPCTASPTDKPVTVQRSGSQPSTKGSPEWFTGSVRSTRCSGRRRPPACPAGSSLRTRARTACTRTRSGRR